MPKTAPEHHVDGGPHLYNFPFARIVTHSNLYNQCAIDYFYGENPAVEHLLAELEGHAASLLARIIQDSVCPPSGSDDLNTLLSFIAIQHSRTAQAAAAQDDYFNKLMQLRFQHKYSDLDQYRFYLEQPVYQSMGLTLVSSPLLYDLHVKLLINETQRDFITSDTPVVFHNQYYEGYPHFGHCGLATKGLQIFFPVSPRHMIMLFDDAVYKVGSAKTNIVPIKQPDDIVAFNSLQFLSAHANIYFTRQDHNSYVEAEAKRLVGRRNPELTSVKRATIGDSAGGASDEGVLASRPNLRLKLRTTVISRKRRVAPPPTPSMLSPPAVRNPVWTAVINDFSNAVMEKKIRFDELHTFCNSHPLLRSTPD